MNEAFGRLIATARQILAGEESLCRDFIPRKENPLPQLAGAAPAVEQRAQMLEAIDLEEVRSCTRCGLCEARSHTVFGEGDPDADLVFVGEGPGQQEDRTGRPFVGRAGELLTRMIQAMGLTRQDVYITNIVKCRPPGNRAPLADEVDACRDYLVRQLQLICPKAIVTLGNPATQNLLGTRVGITRLRGQWQQLPLIGENLGGLPVMPTFHPAFVLRQYNEPTRRKVWADLQKVMEFLGLKPSAEPNG